MTNGNLNWLITVLLIPLEFGAYMYTFASSGRNEDRVVQTEVRAEQRALEIKTDLKDQIVQSEQRVQQALRELKDLIKANGTRPAQ